MHDADLHDMRKAVEHNCECDRDSPEHPLCQAHRMLDEVTTVQTPARRLLFARAILAKLKREEWLVKP